MPANEFNCLPTAIGSMPHTDPSAACADVTRHLKDIPHWPQLPHRSFRENMYAQFSQGFPGIVLGYDSIHVDTAQDLIGPLEEFYAAYLENDIDKYSIDEDYATGLHRFLSLIGLSPEAVKGQITGPVTWGMTVTDAERKPIIYHETLGDVVPKLLKLKVAWQEKVLGQFHRDTIIFIDEPYMSAYGSVAMNLSRQQIIGLLEEVLSGIWGLKGVHCCGNTDWSVLLDTSVNIISYDTYNYAASLSLYPEEVRKFLGRGGTIAWGIVPNDEESLVKESAASLQDRMEEAIAPFTRRDIRFRQLLAQALLTPSCGLDRLSVDAADAALELLAELSDRLRKRYL